jgi:hypothetical protein
VKEDLGTMLSLLKDHVDLAKWLLTQGPALRKLVREEINNDFKAIKNFLDRLGAKIQGLNEIEMRAFTHEVFVSILNGYIEGKFDLEYVLKKPISDWDSICDSAKMGKTEVDVFEGRCKETVT